MPNHIQNCLTINTSIERYREIRNAINGENGIIDFEKIIPMPEILNGTESNNYSSIAQTVIKEQNKETLNIIELESLKKYASMNDEQKKNVDEYIDRYKECGYTDWYDWRIDKWDTKWNAYEITAEEAYHTEQHPIEFWTAWSMPKAIYVALSKMFPDVEFRVEFADEDMGSNCGSVSFINGDYNVEYLAPYWGDASKEEQEKALRFACDVWGYNYEDYTSDEEDENE